MELCEGSVRDIFEFSEEPLLEKEIALIMHESLKVLLICQIIMLRLQHFMK